MKKKRFNYVISYVENVKSTDAKVLTIDVFNGLISSDAIHQTYKSIDYWNQQYADEKIDKKKYEEGYRQAKGQLPAALMQSACIGKRVDANCTPNGLIIIDIDHIDKDIKPADKYQEIWEKLKAAGLDSYVALVHTTPSWHGLRFVVLAPDNLLEVDWEDEQKVAVKRTIKQIQAWWADKMGVERDPVVFNPSRLSFLPKEENILYRNDALLFPANPAEVPSMGIVKLPIVDWEEPKVVVVVSQPKVQQPPVEVKKGASIDLARVEKNLGVKIQDIVARYWEKTGMPYEGSRNTRLADLAAQVRYVVDYNTEAVTEILRRALPTDVAPLEEAEYQSIARSMCKQERTPMSHLMREILGELSAEQHNGTASFIYFAEEMPKLPKRLPKVLYEWSKGAPDMYLPALCNSFFPAAAIYCVDFKVKYLVDGFYYEPHFSELRLGPQSNGKSNIDKFVKTLHQAIRAQDKISLEKIAEYQTKLKKGEKVEELLALVRYLSTNTTMAALLQQLIWNQQVGNYPVFVIGNELYQFYRMSDKDPFTLFRLAYDQGELSANRATLDAVRGVVEHFRMNVLVSSTIPDAQAFFHGHILDGTLSRFSISYLPRQEYGVQPKPFDADMLRTLNERMKPYVANLESTHGAIQCKEIDRMTQRVLNEVYTVSSLIRNDAFDELLRRSVQIGFMKACLLYAANGMKWEKEIEDFVFWSVRSDMWAKMRYFSDEYEQESKRVKTCKKGPQNLLLLLPNHFTMEEAARVLKSQGKDEKKVKNMLKTWKHRQFIAEERNSSDSISYYKLKYNTGE